MSNKSTLARSLEIAAYSTVIVACMLFMSKQIFSTSQANTGGIPGIEVGDQHDALGDLVQKNHDKALVAVVSPDCPYCEKTMPFLQKVVEYRMNHSAPLSVLAAIDISIAPEAEAKQLQKNAVTPDDLVQLDMGALKISAVPTLMLVNRAGEVEGVWQGLPSEEEQEEILQSML